jgi:hypothetical protein
MFWKKTPRVLIVFIVFLIGINVYIVSTIIKPSYASIEHCGLNWCPDECCIPIKSIQNCGGQFADCGFHGCGTENLCWKLTGKESGCPVRYCISGWNLKGSEGPCGNQAIPCAGNQATDCPAGGEGHARFAKCTECQPMCALGRADCLGKPLAYSKCKCEAMPAGSMCPCGYTCPNEKGEFQPCQGNMDPCLAKNQCCKDSCELKCGTCCLGNRICTCDVPGLGFDKGCPQNCCHSNRCQE